MESTSRGGETYEENFQARQKKLARFNGTAQVYGGRIHESVESVEMISSYEIRVSLEFSKGARICYYGFHGVLGLNLHGISVAGGVPIYVGISARQREGCCRRVEGDRPMQICLCVIMRVYSWVEVQRTRYYKAVIFRGNTVWAYEAKNKWVYKVSRLQRQGVHSDCYKGNSQDEEFGVYGLLRLDKD
ncbi:hypothetical protein F2Q69_00004779 [Brassica cretica]|uniref:Uncharacterized protein n=1 Tax=Brassica cretica TaxID=69181 RepID=A0A8S9NZ17_BRACR|nr:hypothetical protein F2Q69_00004779 [Brassica cretica]